MEETGPAEFKKIVELARSDAPHLSVTTEVLFMTDDLVVGHMIWLNGHGSRESIEVLRFREGKFIEHWGGTAEH